MEEKEQKEHHKTKEVGRYRYKNKVLEEQKRFWKKKTR